MNQRYGLILYDDLIHLQMNEVFDTDFFGVETVGILWHKSP